MRPLPSASWLVLPVVLLACQSEEPGGLEATVVRAQLDVNPAQPEALANLDVTVELQGRGQPEEVELGEVTITAQPITDSSNRLTFSATMMNPQGGSAIVRLAVGEEISVRVRNAGTTNADLEAWCRLPAELLVVLQTADGDEATATANVTVQCP